MIKKPSDFKFWGVGEILESNLNQTKDPGLGQGQDTLISDIFGLKIGHEQTVQKSGIVPRYECWPIFFTKPLQGALAIH